MSTKSLSYLVFLGAIALSSSAHAAITIRIGESTPGSATVDAGVGGQAVIGVFASSDGNDPDSFDSFDLYFDLLGDGSGISNPEFSFAPAPVVAGADFLNAAVNPASAGTSPIANADLQVSADRALFTFTPVETKLFDLLIDVGAGAAPGTYTVSIRDDSTFLAAINNSGTNLLMTQPGAFTFTPGVITVNAVAAVPEPSSLTLLAFASVGLMVRRRR